MNTLELFSTHNVHLRFSKNFSVDLKIFCPKIPRKITFNWRDVQQPLVCMHAECLVDILKVMARWRFRKIHTETYRHLSESYDKVPKNTGISKKTQTQIIHTYSQCLKITEK